MRFKQNTLLMGLLLVSSMQIIFAQSQKGWTSFLQGDVETAIKFFEKEAGRGDANAAFVTGMLYIDNRDDAPAIEQGVKWLRSASEKGNGQATYNLFVLNYNQVLDEGESAMESYIERAAEQNSVQAHLFLAQLYSNPNGYLGNDAPVYTKMAEHALKAYKLEKSPLTHFLVGTVYVFNDKLGFGVKQDTDLGIKYLEEAFEGGLMVAAVALQDLYSSGEVITPDEEKAAKYKEITDNAFMDLFAESVAINTPKLLSVYALLDKEQAVSVVNILKKNAEKGIGFADYQLAQIYRNGIPYIAANTELSLHYLQQAAAKDNVKALCELYDQADYVDKNEYLPYLKQAAQQDYIPALMKLADYYRTSNEEGEDRTEALDYYIKAANLGNVEAMQKLAVFYEYGDYYLDLEEDLDEAIKWYTLVIQQQPDNMEAYKNLANIYLGKTTTPNIAKAYEAINHAYTLDSKDEVVLAILAKIYSTKEFEHRDIHKAITIYEDLLANPNLDEEQKSEYAYPLGLLYVDEELGDKKEYAKAFNCFTEVANTKNNAIAYYTIAEIYRLGLGGISADPEKAKDYYRLAIDYYYSQYYDELAHLHLANMLIESDKQKEKEEAIRFYIRLQSNDADKYDFADIILAHIEFDSSQEWVYNKYRQTKSARYLNYIDKGAESGLVGLQYYKALLNAEVDSDAALRELTRLADQHYIPALRKLSEWSEGTQEIEWKIKIATLTNRDSDIYEVLKACLEYKHYEEVVVWYEKLEDDDYSFSKSRVKEAREKLQELKELQDRVKANDAEALHTMAMALQRGAYGTKNEVEAKKLLEKAAGLGYTESLISLAKMYEDPEDSHKQQISTNYLIKAANNGDHSAIIEVGKRYINGIGVKEDREKAKEYFYKAEELEPNYLGSFYIRIMRNYDRLINQLDDERVVDKSPIWWKIRGYLKEGDAVKKDEKRADYILHKLADNGYSDAQVKLGENYATGTGVEQDWEKAAHYLRLSKSNDDSMLKIYDNYVVPASQGDNEAKLKLGQSYLDRSIFYDKPAIEKRAYELIEEAANNGVGEAQYEMYTLYNSNKFACESQHEADAKALEWLNKAIENNYPKAAATLADKYMRIRIPNTSQEETDLKIEQLYIQAAAADSSYVVNLVNFYLNRKIKIDKVVELLESAANEQSPNSFFQLARIYEAEEYGKQNFLTAKGYYDKLIAMGYPDYKINVGDLFIRGDKHLARNQETALKYYTEAIESALSGNKNSEFRIDGIASFCNTVGDGLFYARNNFDKDIDLAVFWYTKAAELGYKSAQEQLFKYYKKQREYAKSYFYGKLSVYDYELAVVSKQLSNEQIEQIDKEVQDFEENIKYLEYFEEYNRVKTFAEEYGGHYIIEYAEVHLEGRIAKKDMAKVVAILEDGGKRGYLFAYNKLGNLYKKEEYGIEQDMDKALYYLKLGAKAGDSNCAHQVGDIYHFGMEGVKQDYVQAAEYFQMTDIEQGLHHTQAKYKLAYIYYNGKGGIKPDIQKAYDLLKLASANGDQMSQKALEEWDFSVLF